MHAFGASLAIIVAAVLSCHPGQPAPARAVVPIIDGFALRTVLAANAFRLVSCNPPADQPPPTTRLGRWCWGSDSLLLIFTHRDSLRQMQLTALVPSGPALLNASAVWQQREAVFRDMMRGPPDSVLTRPSAPLTVHRWTDPRGANAQVLRACWLPSPKRAWRANVWLFDEMWGPEAPQTRVTVEVFADTAFASGCGIGPAKQSTRVRGSPSSENAAA